MLRATTFKRAGSDGPIPFDLVVLPHHERRLRRKLLTLIHGDEVMVDLPETVSFETGDLLVLEDGRHAEVIAAEEPLYEIRGRDPAHLAEILWHLGNRHLSTEVEWDHPAGPRAMIVRDHVIRQMLAGLGAAVTEISEPFSPLQGAYHHAHGHALLAK